MEELSNNNKQRDVTTLTERSKQQQQHAHVLPRAHEAPTNTDHNMGHKTNLNTWETLDINQNMFSDYNGIYLQIKCKKIKGKSEHTWKWSNIYLNNSWLM